MNLNNDEETPYNDRNILRMYQPPDAQGGISGSICSCKENNLGDKCEDTCAECGENMVHVDNDCRECECVNGYTEINGECLPNNLTTAKHEGQAVRDCCHEQGMVWDDCEGDGTYNGWYNGGGDGRSGYNSSYTHCCLIDSDCGHPAGDITQNCPPGQTVHRVDLRSSGGDKWWWCGAP